MLNVITSSVSDSLVRRTADDLEYKVVTCRIRKASTFAEGFGA